jgi:hypothetical protein
MVVEPTSPRHNMDKTLSPTSIGKRTPKKKSNIGLSLLGACLESPPPKRSHCENEGDKARFILQSSIPNVLANISQEKTITIPKELLNKLLDRMKKTLVIGNGNAKTIKASKPPKAQNPNHFISTHRHDLNKIGMTTRSRLDK